MLSKQHYMDKDTHKLLTKSERVNPNNTYIPSFLWQSDINPKLVTGFTMKNGKLINTFSNNIETNVIELYGIRITFHSEFDANISFYDNRKRRRHNISIKSTPNFVARTINRNRTDKLLVYVDFEMTFDNVSNVFRSYLDSLTTRVLFRPIGYLGQRCVESTTKNNMLFFSYGMLNNDFKVEYLGRELEGSCYVFMFGLWAIILQDNLSFDALVLIKGCDRNKIIIDRFIFTSNVYLIKVISLWK